MMQTPIADKGSKRANRVPQEGCCRVNHKPPIWPEGSIGGDGRQLVHHIYMEYRGQKPLREER